MTEPPQQQSEEIGSLLKAYQFIEGRPSFIEPSPNEHKENDSTAGHGQDVPHKAQAEINDSPTKPDPLQKPFPSTPATRLPLADLIGSTEDSNRGNIVADTSPKEQIHWHTLRSPKNSHHKATPAPKNGKRARSSSPPSSQRDVSRHGPDAKEPLDMNNMRGSLKTPKADPAADLWTRYATNTNKDGSEAIPGPFFGNLMGSSSPYTAEGQASNVSGLRRWTSCGMEWPSSKAKRRKTNHNVREQIEDVFMDVEEPTAGGGNVSEVKKSRIGSLLERIQESLAKSPEQVETKGPSSSSPLPEKTNSFDRQSLSPTKPLETTGYQLDQMQTTISGVAIEAGTTENDKTSKTSDSFGFESDDLDITAFESRETIRSRAAQNVDEEFGENGDNKPPHEESVMRTTSGVGNTLTESAGNGSEFDDDDEGFTVEDFDQIGSLCDQDKGDPTSERPNLRYTTGDASNKIGSGMDEFEDEDVDEDLFAAAEFAATQSVSASVPSKSFSNRKVRTIQRYLVKSVAEGEYETAKGQMQPEKVLLVEDEKPKLCKAITLRQSWFDTRCSKGSYVHVIGEFDGRGQCIIDDDQNMLILHPDHLISALVVADSFSCLRRAVLQDRVKATGDASPAQVYGVMLHEIFQESMRLNRWDETWLTEIIGLVVARHMEELYEIKLDVPEVVDHLQSKMQELQAWAEVFVKAKPGMDATIKDRNGKQVAMSVNKLLDVEENVWSPMYGLKGNVDATVQVEMHDDQGTRTLTVPFEVKTGKNTSNTSHRAQTALYTLLISDRYDVAVAYGILYYLETSETSRIPAIRHELRHMVMQRNELACYLLEHRSLPPMLRNTHSCNRCYAKVPCFVYHKLVEDGDGETSGLRDKFEQVVRHLNSTDQEFFMKWDALLTKEESESMKFRRELWTMLSKERQELGRCFANVVLEPGTAREEPVASKIMRCQYTFRKFDQNSQFSFNESQISVGEPIVISDERGHYALAKGYVRHLTKRSVTVAVDRRLHNARVKQAGFDSETNQVFSGIMEIDNPNLASNSISGSQSRPCMYRIDKDEFSNGMATVRNNLVQVMTDDIFHAREIRKLVVEGVEPKFKDSSQDYSTTAEQNGIEINEDQKAAIEKIMTAQDYALVLGMPGTGKTTTIAHIIRALVAKGKSVLLTSYTHNAVDNILLKLRQDNVGILRLGSKVKIHPDVQKFATISDEPRTSLEELEEAYQTPQVVATTCLGINHQVFRERIFDYCIVDEASQITLPVCLGPIRMARAFVLVGDHYQLPPLVQNSEALEGGLDISLFKLLCERHPNAVATLRHQYRMNSAIMSLSNTLIYDGRLICGSDEVASEVLDIPHFDQLSELHASGNQPCSSHLNSTCWLSSALDPTSAPVCFLNTDTLRPSSFETRQGVRITNKVEAELTAQLLNALLTAGVAPSSIGIITLYRSQLALIKSILHAHTYSTSTAMHVGTERVEVHTTDRFQGRDKEVVILSCVRNNDANIVGDLLRDWRRVNVALTRARKKMIIIGSKSTLSNGDELLNKLVDLCAREKWTVDLPAIAASEGSGHIWNDGNVVPSAPRRTQDIDSSPGKTPARNKTKDKKPLQEATAQGNETRSPLQPRSGNINKSFKVPSKVGKVTEKAALGSSNIRASRPVFADIVNDVMGEGFFD